MFKNKETNTGVTVCYKNKVIVIVIVMCLHKQTIVASKPHARIHKLNLTMSKLKDRRNRILSKLYNVTARNSPTLQIQIVICSLIHVKNFC